MVRWPVIATSKYIGFSVLLPVIVGSAWAQKAVHCPDGDHVQIDVKQIAIQYDASSFAGTLSSLSVLSARLEVGPKKLQEAAAATQQWDELLRGLAAGYNSCAVTRQQYADGLNRIYPRLQEDAADLEAIRKVISAGQQTDLKRLQSLLDSYWNNLRQFAQSGGEEIIMERIESLSEQVTSGQGQILQKEDLILQKLKEFEQRKTQAPVPTPAEVGTEVSEVRKGLLAKADVAEQAYDKGYKLMDQYRYREAIPYLRQALAAVTLPDFYIALGLAYWQLPDLNLAESNLREGLKAVAGKNDDHEVDLANMLGLVLKDKGDLDGALTYTKRALQIDEGVHGPDHPTAAALDSNIGMILKDKGDLHGAFTYTQRALEIDVKAYGPDDHKVAVDANNIGMILYADGNLIAALNFVTRALDIDVKVYGRDHPNVAIYSSNIGEIARVYGYLDLALTFTQGALEIDKRVYGPDHPRVAVDANNIGQILKGKGDLDGALTYTQQALDILTKCSGPDNLTTKTVSVNLEQIKQAKKAKQR